MDKLKSGNPSERSESAIALGGIALWKGPWDRNIGNEKEINELFQALSDEDEEVRCEVSNALMENFIRDSYEIGDDSKRLIILQQAKNDECEYVREYVSKIISHLNLK